MQLKLEHVLYANVCDKISGVEAKAVLATIGYTLSLSRWRYNVTWIVDAATGEEIEVEI